MPELWVLSEEQHGARGRVWSGLQFFSRLPPGGRPELSADGCQGPLKNRSWVLVTLYVVSPGPCGHPLTGRAFHRTAQQTGLRCSWPAPVWGLLLPPGPGLPQNPRGHLRRPAFSKGWGFGGYSRTLVTGAGRYFRSCLCKALCKTLETCDPAFPPLVIYLKGRIKNVSKGFLSG